MTIQFHIVYVLLICGGPCHLFGVYESSFSSENSLFVFQLWEKEFVLLPHEY